MKQSIKYASLVLVTVVVSVSLTVLYTNKHPDLNRDGVVDNHDLYILLSKYTKK